MPDWNGLSQFLKRLPPVSIAGGVALTSGAPLFAPNSFVNQLRLSTLIDAHGHWFGLAFLIATAVLAVHGLGWCRKRYLQRQSLQIKERQLHILTAEEKAYLAPYVLNGVNSCKFYITDGVAGGLTMKDILYRASNLGDMSSGFAFNIQPWALEYLQQHPDLLEGASQPQHDLEVSTFNW